MSARGAPRRPSLAAGASTGTGHSARFDTKQAAREHAWRALSEAGAARFPFPVVGRIPNFAGAEDAARRLFELEPWREARAIKVNPDSPQAHVRHEALRRGITVYVPTPRLAGGFHCLDPNRIPAEHHRDASRLSRMASYSEPVTLSELPQLDCIVAGSAAVTLSGKRCGKGAGYSDLEYALLLELGHDAVPVATTVHALQIVGDFPVEENDIPLHAVVTPGQAHVVPRPPAPPSGIFWDRLDAAALEAMPVIAELKALRDAADGEDGRKP